MNARKKNQLFVTCFLLGMFIFTGIMTFVVGPILMEKRDQVAQDKILFKCQSVLDGSTIEVQMRAWERPNTNPVFKVKLAGLDAPPLGDAEDPQVIAWAESHNLSPALIAKLNESAFKNLQAFIRKQNLFLYREDGSRGSQNLSDGSYVHVFVAGSHANLKQIRSGLALHDTSRPHAFSDQYAEAQAAAKAQHKGLWAKE
ncbi:thermonuclease family protein [Kiritimatiellaeota bacterium B1221]|nr:thermonuclease family protein [Kiritimatiellaeota bacterium B1221]